MPTAILVPLDGSAFADQSIPFARTVAAQLDATLHIVSVYQPVVSLTAMPGGPLYERQYDEEQRALMASRLQARAESLAPLVPTGVTHATPEGDDIVKTILAEAERVGARLIVTTTHGRGGFQRVWLGSVADALVRSSSIPLLLVRPELPEQPAKIPTPMPVDVAQAPAHPPFRKLLLPLDGSPLAEEAIEPGLALLPAEGAAVRLLRVARIPATRLAPEGTVWTTQERKEMDELRAEGLAYLEDASRNLLPSTVDVSSTVPLHSSPASAILSEAEEWGADLIAMSTHAREGFQRLMVGSVADKVYRGASIPTLVIPPSR